MIINKKRERITSQKKIIIDYLKSVKTHPSAETVYLMAKNKLPRISRGTVYRILKKLKEKGEIQVIPAEVTRYDGDLSQHSHFICQKCNKIFDLFEKIGKLKLNKIKVGKIEKYQIYFYGQCKSCQRK